MLKNVNDNHGQEEDKIIGIPENVELVTTQRSVDLVKKAKLLVKSRERLRDIYHFCMLRSRNLTCTCNNVQTVLRTTSKRMIFSNQSKLWEAVLVPTKKPLNFCKRNCILHTTFIWSNLYTRVPNKRVCTTYLILTKLPPCTRSYLGLQAYLFLWILDKYYGLMWINFDKNLSKIQKK